MNWRLDLGPGDTVSTDILRNMGMSLSNTDTPYRCVSLVIQTPHYTLAYYSVGIMCMLCYYYCSTRWVKVEGVEYRQRCIVIVGMDDDDPIFGCIEAV